MKSYNVRYFYLGLLLTYSINLGAMEVGEFFPNIRFVIPAEIINIILQFSLENPEVKELGWGKRVNHRTLYKNLLLVCKAWKEFIANSNKLLGKVLRSEIAEHFSTYMMKQNFSGYICNKDAIPSLAKMLAQNCTLDLNPLSLVKYQHFIKQDPKKIQQGVGALKTLFPPNKENREVTLLFIAASIGCLQYFQAIQNKNPKFFDTLSNDIKKNLKEAAKSYVEIVKLLNDSSQ